jgi:hypothetical protein
VLTPVADGVAVHQIELLKTQTVVVQGGSGVLVVDPGITTAELACLAGDLRGRPDGFRTPPQAGSRLGTTSQPSARPQ